MTRPYAFENPPLMQTPDGQILAEYLSRQLLLIQESIASDELGVTWRGEWEDGTYAPYEMVTDDGWLAIPNTETTERPSPQPQGDAFNIIDLPGAPTWSSQSQSAPALYVGQRYTVSEDGYLLAVRYYLDPALVGFSMELGIVHDPTTDPDIEILIPEFTIAAGDTGAIKEVPLDLHIVRQNDAFDVVSIYRPTTGAITFTYPWSYVRQNGDPVSGEARHQSGQNADQIRFHQNDDGGTDRSTDLDNIGPGSRIEMLSSGFEWDVLSASKTGSVYTFIVEPASRAGAATSDFTFTYYGTLAIPYAEAINHFSAFPNIRGFVTQDYVNSIVLNANAYGVDVRVQQALISDDWDYLAYSR